MKYLLLILIVFATFGCSQRKSRKIVVPTLGKFVLSDSVSTDVKEETLQIQKLEDSALLNDYRVEVFDSNVTPANLIKYSSMADIVTELNARGRYEDLYLKKDTLIPRARPKYNPAFFQITTLKLQSTKDIYSPTTDYNDSTFKINNTVITVGQRKNAAKVLALIETRYFPADLFNSKTFTYNLKSKDSVSKRYKICDSSQKWKFWQCPSLAFGTAIPITRNIVLTAGHCVNDVDINHFYLVLGYNDTTSSTQRFDFDTTNIYKGIAVVDMAYDTSLSNSDYCFILLNKDLPASAVMEYKKVTSPEAESKFYLIGYPLGIPERISMGHLISRDAGTGIYTLFIDSFGGNSGSPVFESKTDSLVGMLYFGEYDFMKDPVLRCNSFRFCPTKLSCLGERVESISALLTKPMIKKYLGK